MLLRARSMLITGVLTPQSLAYGIAELAQEEGAEVVLTGFGRGMSLTERSAKRLIAGPRGAGARRDQLRALRRASPRS